MINRLTLATACLLLALIPAAIGWRVHNASVSQYEITDTEDWTSTSREKKPVYSSGQKHSYRVTAKQAAPEYYKSPANSQGVVLPTTLKENHADTGAELNLPEQTPAQLWQTLETLLIRSEFQQIPIIGALLAERLHTHPDPAVYQNIEGLLAEPNLPVESKAIVLDLLGEIATPDALTQLLNQAGQGMDSPLYILALQTLSRIGDNRWDGRFHEELSPALEAAWSKPESNDQAYLTAVGKAIAGVGAPSGVDHLLLTVSGSNKDKDSEETNRIKQAVAFNVIPEVRNPDAVAVLGAKLKQEPLGTSAFEVSGEALKGINTLAATQEIVDWAKQAPAEGARNLKGWLSEIDDDNSLKSISAAQNQVFQHPEIEAVIDKAAANIDANSEALSAATMGEESGDVSMLPLLDEPRHGK